jgi:ABC-type transport system involved in cytochrome c biogenesis permease subunit
MKTLQKYLPIGIVVLSALMLVGRASVPSGSDTRRDLYSFGAIPVQHGGRVQPLDSVARNSLVVISGKQEFEDPTDNDRVYKATDWLLILWAKPEQANKFRVFRADHPQVLSLLGLTQRPGSYRYSMNELEEKGGIEKLESQSLVAGRKTKEQRDHYDEKVLQLARQVQVYRELQFRKNPGLIPVDDPTGKWLSYGDIIQTAAPAFFRNAEGQVREDLTAELHKDPGLLGSLVRRYLPDARDWEEVKRQFGGEERLAKAVIDAEVKARVLPIARETFLKSLPDTYPPAATMEKILSAYQGDDPAAFNAAVAEYHEKHTGAISDSDKQKARLEARMNHLDPFLQCAALYVGVAILAALSWLVWHESLRKAAFYLACLTLVVHSAALLSRMYIGNRPPVTNLYSSAVFIGWGGLALCLLLERIYKLGIGSFVGAILGFSTMLVARFLAESGDTLEMLQAVLDTNFWLATHVTTVTLGYVATFVAGLIAIVYIVGGMFTNGMRGDQGKQVAGMIYGTLCFATLLSFTGTVLGGIWADVSWGRFWGWDPKENGAVLIVIWNALILHARWGGMVKARGMAILAVFGNMVAAWSWFGTNQLGIGLHAYGFDNRLATGCAVFWVSQLLIAVLGMIPLRHWASFGEAQAARA